MADLDFLIRKYNTQGPRYTSYPTVPYWDTTPTPNEWISHIYDALQKAATENTGAALYIHIPFCGSLCTFCGCTTHITKKQEYARPYLDAVLKELDLYTKALNGRRLPLSEVHLGGGTPTWLIPEDLDYLMTGILARTTIRDDLEMSLEVDPRVTTREHLTVLYKHGFRRISLGVQDFNLKTQEAINRVQSIAQVEELTDIARDIGYTSVNYDLVYGLPYQTPETMHETMREVCRLRPDRIAFYSYAHVPWIKPGQRSYTDKDLPEAQQKLELYQIGRHTLLANGYLDVGMDHFALPTDSLVTAKQNGTLHRNFMGYISRKVHPMIGLGMSSIGDTGGAFMQNKKTVKEYQDCIDRDKLPIYRGHVLSPEDIILRHHITNIMTKHQTSWNETHQYTPYIEGVQNALSEAIKDELILLNDCQLTVTDKGKPFLRNIAMAFDARLFRKSPEQKIFSETI